MLACLAAIPALLAANLAGSVDAAKTLPPEAAKALHAARQVELYSLEPWFDDDTKEAKWHGYVLLGHTTLAADEAKQAVAQVDAAITAAAKKQASCVEPRQALSVESEGHKYDFLLSYDCHSLEVYGDDKKLATLAAAGSPAALNKLLAQAKVPLSQSAGD